MPFGALVRAAREQRHQNHQVRQSKQPLVRLDSGRLCSARDKAQMAALREVAQMLDADASQTRNFRIGEDLLARFDGNHDFDPLSVSPPSHLDAGAIVVAAINKSNGRSVLEIKNGPASTLWPKARKDGPFCVPELHETP